MKLCLLLPTDFSGVNRKKNANNFIKFQKNFSCQRRIHVLAMGFLFQLWKGKIQVYPSPAGDGTLPGNEVQSPFPEQKEGVF